MIIDYTLLQEIITSEPDRVYQITKFLTIMNKIITVEQIYKYYLYPYFTRRMENGYTDFFDISNFLDFAVYDYYTFEEEIIKEFEI